MRGIGILMMYSGIIIQNCGNKPNSPTTGGVLVVIGGLFAMLEIYSEMRAER